jgi:hypothetical protein
LNNFAKTKTLIFLSYLENNTIHPQRFEMAFTTHTRVWRNRPFFAHRFSRAKNIFALPPY